MPAPDYQRPFSHEDFRGYFQWTEELTNALVGVKLYHACHKKTLLKALDQCYLDLRSEWSIDLPEHGVCSVPGTWTGLNFYHRGNKYGPFLIQFPLSMLNGKQFIVFRRTDAMRHRHFFVQYEARIPIYSFKGEEWRTVDPKTYFEEDIVDGLNMKNHSIYDILVTQRLPLGEAIISAVAHPDCISKKCSGSSLEENQDELSHIGRSEIERHLANSDFYQALIRRFPDAVGKSITVRKPGRRR
jgi:hypothetical protein